MTEATLQPEMKPSAWAVERAARDLERQEKEANAAYKTLVERVAAGQEVESEEIQGVIRAAGKSINDFKIDVEKRPIDYNIDQIYNVLLPRFRQEAREAEKAVAAEEQKWRDLKVGIEKEMARILNEQYAVIERARGEVKVCERRVSTALVNLNVYFEMAKHVGGPKPRNIEVPDGNMGHTHLYFGETLPY